ncbi:hypothetical protein GQ457_07G004360 [Hibiscus cannabinus]
MLNTLGQFGGSPAENARQHLKLFPEICNSFKIHGVSTDVLKLNLFPYSLRDKAKAWLNNLPPGSQEDDEAMHEAWERYRDLFRRCPMHGFPEWNQVSIFYNSVNTPTRMMLDVSANDTLLDKPPRECLEILEKLAQNDYQNPTTRRGNMRRGNVQLDSSDTILAQISALTNMVKKIQTHLNVRRIQNQVATLGNSTKITNKGIKFVAHTSSSIVPDKPTEADIPAEADEDHTNPSEPKEADSAAEAPHIKLARTDKLEERRPAPPFPQRMKKQKQDYQFKKFFDILKQVHINLPLVEVFQQMPKYAKFLKDVVFRKTRIGEFVTAAGIEACLAMMHNKVPAKKTNPGSFKIPCSIGNNYSTKALCDPGASITLMPKSVFQKLGIGESKPTNVMLQLADRSYVQPEGKIKDIMVRVDKFIFPVEFLILDCEADEHAPIILGRPFLDTRRALLDFKNGELVLRVNDQQVKIDVFKTMKHLEDSEDSQIIEATTKFDPDTEITCLSREYLINLGSTDSDITPPNTQNHTNSATGNWVQHTSGKNFEPLNYTDKESKTDKPSIEQPLKLELKHYLNN